MALPHLCLLRLVTLTLLSLCLSTASAQRLTLVSAPNQVPRYGLFEAAIRVANPVAHNPFTEATFEGTFTSPGGKRATADGFCDSADGTLFKVRFCPSQVGACRYELTYTDRAGKQTLKGRFNCANTHNPGPVIADPQAPQHFIYAGSSKHFYHLGITAYHLLMPENSDADIRHYVDWCAAAGFNKIRFLLAGYALEGAYGAPPGLPTPVLPWPGGQDHLDFTRFDVGYWQRAERAITYMRDKGIVATVILMIEKDDLPMQLGALSEHEYRYYRCAVARLAAYHNVWFDLGNEHNEYRQVPDWANTMGPFIRQHDPYGRLISAHGYADFAYGDQDWAGYIITQQYGTPQEVNAWALKYRQYQKPYVNEEYGYEGNADKPGHQMNVNWVRRCHWALALAGGYATYGDWLPHAPFYLAHIGAGQAPPQLKLLPTFFEQLPYWQMQPANHLVSDNALCLAKPGEAYLIYLPDGGTVQLDLPPPRGTKGTRPQTYLAKWFDPRLGSYNEPFQVQASFRPSLAPPSAGDWALLLRTQP